MPVTHQPNGISSFGSIVHGGQRPTMGREFYVRSTSDTGYEKWKKDMNHTVRGGGQSVHTTIESAVAAAAAWDTIWVYPGFYEPASTITITQKGLRILAVQTGPFMSMSSTMMYACGTAACDPILAIDTSNVEIAGFRFYPYLLTGAEGISIADSVSAYGSWIHDNIFYVVPEGMDGNMPVNIQMGNSTFDAAYTVIERNYFFCGGDRTNTLGMINWTLATRSCVQNNYFNIIGNFATQSGIHIESAAGPRGWILDNRFLGAEIGVDDIAAYGVLWDDTSVAGDYMIDGNSSVNLASVTSDTDNRTNGVNYVDGTAI